MPTEGTDAPRFLYCARSSWNCVQSSWVCRGRSWPSQVLKLRAATALGVLLCALVVARATEAAHRLSGWQDMLLQCSRVRGAAFGTRRPASADVSTHPSIFNFFSSASLPSTHHHHPALLSPHSLFSKHKKWRTSTKVPSVLISVPPTRESIAFTSAQFLTLRAAAASEYGKTTALRSSRTTVSAPCAPCEAF